MFENINCYGDHENDNLVYCLPDEVGFSKTNLNGSYDYELMVQLFKNGQSIQGALDELKKNTHGILSFGFECKISESPLEKSLEELIHKIALPKNTSAVVPASESGKVDLMALKSTTLDANSRNNYNFVKGIIGSKSPSLLIT